MQRHARLLLLLLVPIALAGCASVIGRGDWDPFRSSEERRVTIVVQNQSLFAVTVRAIAPGRRTSLGTVEGNARVSFLLPWSAEQELRVELQIVGGNRHTMGPIYLIPGDRIEVLVREPLSRSITRR